MTLKDEQPSFATAVATEPEISVSNPIPSAPPEVKSEPPAPVQGTSSAHTKTSTTTTTTATHSHPAQSNVPQPALRGLGRAPCSITCPYCKAQCTTRANETIECATIMGVVVLLLVFWPLFWLPLVVPGCKGTEHNCGKCNRVVGKVDACE